MTALCCAWTFAFNAVPSDSTASVKIFKCGIDAFQAEAREGCFQDVEAGENDNVAELDEEGTANF